MNVKHDLTIKYDGEVVGTANDMFMPSDATIDIVPDHNIISCSGYSSFISQYGAAPIDGRYHVYRHHENTASSITPKFAVDRKYLPPEDYGPSPIIEWEFHIRNDLASGNITVNPPSVTVGGNSNYFTKVVALTDQMYVERGKTNVYVFRVDTYSTAKALTYSLAYIY